MDPDVIRILPKDFPDELIRIGIFHENYEEALWKYEEAIDAAIWYTSYDYAILGGDVYCSKNGIYEYDSNWYVDRDLLTWPDYVQASLKKALAYITSHHEKNGDEYYYVLAVSPETRKYDKYTGIELPNN